MVRCRAETQLPVSEEAEMQVLIQVVCTRGPSLRKAIANDSKLADYGLKVTEHKKQDRPHGWTKVRCPGLHGAVNMEWEAGTRVLTARVVTKKGGSPDAIIGVFVGFVLERFFRRVESISIVPRG